MAYYLKVYFCSLIFLTENDNKKTHKTSQAFVFQVCIIFYSIFKL